MDASVGATRRFGDVKREGPSSNGFNGFPLENGARQGQKSGLIWLLCSIFARRLSTPRWSVPSVDVVHVFPARMSADSAHVGGIGLALEPLV